MKIFKMRKLLRRLFQVDRLQNIELTKNERFAFLGIAEFNHADFILEIVKLTNCKKYLELGIYDCTTIGKISNYVDYAVGVDIEKKFMKNINFTFYHGSTDDYFSKNTELFDIVFIDADHSIESVRKDFSNSLSVLNKYGIILLHDTDPINPKYTDLGYCGNSYLMNEVLEKEYQYLNFITLPFCEAGITIINRKNQLRIND
jgi:hypothetical protein